MTTITPDLIAGPQEVIHPCLDWIKGQLIVGVNLRKAVTSPVVLSSTQGLTAANGLGTICEQGKSFRGAVSQRVAEDFGKHLETPNEERTPENGNKLLVEIADYLRKFVIFPEAWFPDVLATWMLGTNLFPLFQTYPYLWITSPEPGCGKSLLGGLIAKLSFNGEFMVAPTEAQLFHLPESSRGVQVWDEVENREETDTKKFNMMRPVLLNGYRNGGVVPRQVGRNFEKAARYHVFCPRVLIGLTKLPETAQQRSIQIRLVQVSHGQSADLYIGANQANEEYDLRDRCLLWALQTVEQVNSCYQNKDLRTELHNLLGPGRISDDIWLPMVAVASAATGDGSTLIGTLKEAATQLATTAGGQSVNPWVAKSAVQEPKNESEDEEDNVADLVKVALDRLELAGPMEPEKLAFDVSVVSGEEITAQRLSKELAKLKIRSKKQGGRRIFAPTDSERTAALQKLGDRRGGRAAENGKDKAKGPLVINSRD
jgi:hypothetical protein